MNRLKMLGLAVVAAMALVALAGASGVSATVLCKTNVNTETCSEPYFAGQSVEASLKKETAAVLETLMGTTLDTCTGTTLKGKVTNAGSETESAKANIEELAWSGCTKTTKTLAAGSLEMHWIEGTDNATLTSSGTEWTANTIFGDCIYGFGTNHDLGTLTGGNPATVALNTIIPKLAGNAACPAEVRWTAEYTFTAPTPLYFTRGEGSPTGVLCTTNVNTETCSEPYFAGQSLEASLKKETTAVLETTTGTTLQTCTGTTLKGKVTNAGSSTESAKASVEELGWSGCSKTTDTLKGGSLEFHWIEGTDNGTLTASGAEWTINTIFGSCNYGYGSNLDLGTLTGGNPAAISINTVIPLIAGGGLCPVDARWTAEYAVTVPAPLYFTRGEGSPTGVLCKTNVNTETCSEPYFAGQSLEASLKKETTAVLETIPKEGGPITLDTCTGTTLKGKVTNAGSSSEAAKASIEELAWSGCTKTTTTLAKGSLAFHWIEGTDDATLTASGTEWTANTIFGSCIYGFGTGTDLGTLKGGGPATITVSAVIPKTGGGGLCPEQVRWTAEYTFTAPEPLYFTAG